MEKLGKLVLFQGGLDTLDLFSRQLEQGFLHIGYEVFDFNLQQSAFALGLLYDFMKDGPITAMIGFNMALFGMRLPSGENVWETLDIPCINILVDHPYWYHNILMCTPRTGIVLNVDRYHSQYTERFYPHIPCTGFLPHGGTPTDHVLKPIAERTIDVLYAGSLLTSYIISQKPDFTRFQFAAEEVCQKSIAWLLAHPDSTVESVIEDQLLRADIVLTDEELRKFISSCAYIERVVNSHYKERILGSIAKSGISLTLYGGGWPDCDWINLPNVHYCGCIAPEKILEKMEDSKIVLNAMPWFKDGSHERVFNAMLRGAAVVSETSFYLEETLPDDSWVSFGLWPDSLAALPQKIIDLLSDERKLQSIADAGYRLALPGHSWQARAQELHNDLLSLL